MTAINKNLFIVSIIVVCIGAAIAGASVLAGGADALTLPGFLQAVFG